MNLKPAAGIAVAATLLLAVAGCTASPAPTGDQTSTGGSSGPIDASAEGVSQEAADTMNKLYADAKAAGETELSVISGLNADMAPVYAAFTKEFGIPITGNDQDEIGAPLIQDLQGQVTSGQYRTDVLQNPNGQQYVKFAQPYHVVSLTVPDELKSSANELQPGADYKTATGDSAQDMWESPFLGFFGLGIFQPRAGALNPTKWSDLADPKYAGQLGMGAVTVPGPNQDAPIYLEENGALNDAQVQAILKNAGSNVKGTYGDAIAGLMQGQYAFMFAAPSSAVVGAAAKGAPVKFTLMSQDNYVVTHKFLLMKNAPHPNLAKLWLEWLNTKTAGEAIAGTGLAPLNTAFAAATSDKAPWTDWKKSNVTSIVSSTKIDSERDSFVAKFKSWLGQ